MLNFFDFHIFSFCHNFNQYSINILSYTLIFKHIAAWNSKW